MKTDGGPAFPAETADTYYTGLSLRDWFAGQALHGILAGKAGNMDLWDCETPEMTARQAFERADAMLRERDK